MAASIDTVSSDETEIEAQPMLHSDQWRDVLIHQIDPRARDTILDVGCGAGDLAVMLKLDSPGTSVFGLDARPGQLNIAERQACAADARVNFVYATFADVTAKLAAQSPSQIICSNVLGYLPPHRRRMLLAAMFAALPRGGVLHLADKGWRRLSGLMAQPPWARANEFRDSALASMRDAGFADCAVTSVVPSGKAQHTLFRGVKP